MLGVSVPEALLLGSAIGLGAFAVRSQREDVASVRASDGREYLVQNAYPDRVAAAEMLARLRARLDALLAFVAGRPDLASDPRFVRLRANWNRDTLNEGSNHSSYTSFTVDKTDITMCLRSASTNRLEPESLLTFVLLHEAAHCATVYADNAHNADFWANFKYILEVAVAAGLYVKQDFKAQPVVFCGVDVTDSPLH